MQGVLMSRDSKKQDNLFGQQRDEWRRAYAEALTVRERFPRVELLVIDMAFIDLKGVGRYSAQLRSFSPSAKAFFAIACPRTLCLHGGFDLEPLIVKLLHDQRAASTGNLKCNGWVHPDRREDARCLLQMRYRLEVLYDQSKASSASRRAGA